MCPWDKPGLPLKQTQVLPYFTQCKHSLSLGQTGRSVAEKVCVLEVYVPFSLTSKMEGQSLKMSEREHSLATVLKWGSNESDSKVT